MAARFQPTRWSLVQAAADGDPIRAQAALEELCSAYWYPLYAWARRRGHAPADAEDLVQDFFASLLEKHWVEAADPERGRFRTFLLTALGRHAAHVRERQGATKRGGGWRRLSFDREEGERRYAREPRHDLTPERLFERRWALVLLERALEAVRRDYEERGQGVRFVALRAHLPGGTAARPHAEIAAELGMSESAVKVAVHRLRQAYREHLRSVVADTVETDADVDQELRALLTAL